MRSVNTKATPKTGPNGERITPLASLVARSKNWTIKVRCTARSEISAPLPKDSGKDERFNLLFTDASGNLRGAFWGRSVRDWHDKWEVGKAYYISKGSVTFNNRHGLAIRLDANAEFVETEDPEIPFFLPKPLNVFTSGPDHALSDIVVIAFSMSTPRKANGKGATSKLIELQVRDKTQTAKLSLWDSAYRAFPLAKQKCPFVMALKDTRLLSRVTMESGYWTHIEFDPDIPEAHELKEWYIAQGHSFPNPRA